MGDGAGGGMWPKHIRNNRPKIFYCGVGDNVELSLS
jgi:hypothetical protein